MSGRAVKGGGSALGIFALVFGSFGIRDLEMKKIGVWGLGFRVYGSRFRV